MNLTLLTPDQEIFSGEIISVKVPGTGGQFEILKGHAPIVSSLAAGQVRILDGTNNSTTYQIQKGFVEVINDEVSLLVQGLIQ